MSEVTAGAAEVRRGAWPARLLALAPVLLLAAIAAGFVAWGGGLTGLVGQNPPAPDRVDVRRVAFEPGQIRVLVRNPQPQDLTIAQATVDDAVVPFRLEGPRTLGRLRSATVVIPFDWVEDDPYTVGITTSNGIQTVAEVPAAVPTPGLGGRSVGGYALIGVLVGVVPVALGMLWLPALRRADPRWLVAFMALTAGLLTFLAVDALAEALELQAALPSALGGAGLVVLGVAASYLGLSWVAERLTRREGAATGGATLGGTALALMIAIGIGLHNMGEGLAIGTSFALGELALGTFLIVGFMVHNVTEGLGIAAPLAEGRRPRAGLLAALVLVAGLPTVAGAWIGGFITDQALAVLFFAIATGAALQVVVEVGRYVARRAPEGLRSGAVVGGFLAGIAIMYLTGLLVG